MVTGLTHAALRVTDIPRALEFYTGLMGFSEQFRLTHDDGTPWLVYLKIAERQFIELHPGAIKPRTSSLESGITHICLEVDDIHETYRELTSRGLVTRGQPGLGADGSWQFWTDDPDGNPIEFHQFTSESRQLKG